MCDLSKFNHLRLDSYHKHILESELRQWHSDYLPLHHSSVVDIGAGNGETCQFFLNHGAERVLCIEPEADLLIQNFAKDPRVTIWPFAVDFIKSDCEGGERDMLLEIHFPYRLRMLRSAPVDRVYIVRVEEYWGNILRKGVRLLATRLFSRLF